MLLCRLNTVVIQSVLIILHIHVVLWIHVVVLKTIYWTLLSCSIQMSVRSGMDFLTQPVPVQQLWLQHLHLPVLLTLQYLLLSLLPIAML